MDVLCPDQADSEDRELITLRRSYGQRVYATPSSATSHFLEEPYLILIDRH